jgi:hypothetical protein
MVQGVKIASAMGPARSDGIRALDLLDSQLFVYFSLQGEVENARRRDRLGQTDNFRVERKILFDLIVGGDPGTGERGF